MEAVKEAREILETAQVNINNEVPKQFEHTLQKEPMLTGDECKAIDEQEFNKTVANRTTLFWNARNANEETRTLSKTPIASKTTISPWKNVRTILR